MSAAIINFKIRSKNDSICTNLNAPFPNTNVLLSAKIQAMHHSFEFIHFCDIIVSFLDTRFHYLPLTAKTQQRIECVMCFFQSSADTMNISAIKIFYY